MAYGVLYVHFENWLYWKLVRDICHCFRTMNCGSQEDVALGLQRILAAFAPPCLSQLIGRKMGLEHVDIISELCDRSMALIIRQICGYLTDADICR